MTKRKHAKRRARALAAETGARYTTALQLLRQEEETTMDDISSNEERSAFVLHCSFCNKTSDHVEKLVAGPGVYICDECASLATDIIEGERQRAGTEDQHASLEDRSDETLLEIFSGMATARSNVDRTMRSWAAALAGRGVTRAQIAAAAGVTHEEAQRELGS